MQHSESALAQPLWHNPRIPGSSDVPEATARAIAARGLTHVRDLTRFIRINTEPSATHDATSIEADGIVWRALREDERPAKGLKPPNPNGTLSVAEAIERGSKDAPSNYVHATRDLLVAAHFAISRQDGKRTTSHYRTARSIVAIDVRRLRACTVDASAYTLARPPLDVARLRSQQPPMERSS